MKFARKNEFGLGSRRRFVVSTTGSKASVLAPLAQGKWVSHLLRLASAVTLLVCLAIFIAVPLPSVSFPVNLIPTTTVLEAPFAPSCDIVSHQDASGYTTSFCGPSILVGGAMKCGTNSVGALIGAHPRIKIKRCVREDGWDSCNPDIAQGPIENHNIWEQHAHTHLLHQVRDKLNVSLDEAVTSNTFQREMMKFLPDIQPGSRQISMIKSPSYIDAHIFPESARLLKQTLPHIKVVFTLCDPTGRLWSEYNHLKGIAAADDIMVSELKKWCNLETFEDTIEACLDASNSCPAVENFRDTIRKGLYAEHVQHWIDIMGKDQVSVFSLDDLQGPNGRMYAEKLMASVGLPPSEFDWENEWTKWHSKKHFANKAVKGYDRNRAPPEAARRLALHYRNANVKLMEHLDFPAAHEWLPENMEFE